nr:hypothetical protein K-LCC10_0442 [Kaumoebavirus]
MKDIFRIITIYLASATLIAAIVCAGALGEWTRLMDDADQRVCRLNITESNGELHCQMNVMITMDGCEENENATFTSALPCYQMMPDTPIYYNGKEYTARSYLCYTQYCKWDGEKYYDHMRVMFTVGYVFGLVGAIPFLLLLVFIRPFLRNFGIGLKGDKCGDFNW